MAAVAEITLPRYEQSRADAAHAQDAEFELLLACCHAELAGGTIRPDAIPPLNWVHLLKAAEHHRVLPALYAALHDTHSVPSAAWGEIQSRFRNHVQRTLRLSSDLIEILREFDGRKIEVMSYKGPAMAQFLFGDAVMRHSGDIDLLVRPADVPRATAALQELGYTPNLTLSSRQERAYRRIGNDRVFGCERGKNLVELHWQILPRFFSVAFEMERLFSRSLEIEFEGRRVRVPGREDQLLVLCAHAAKHEWEHLGMLRDIARLACFDLDWEWVQREAKKLGISKILAVSLLLVQNALGVRLRVELGSADKCKTLANLYESGLRTNSPNVPESFRYFRQMLTLRERWSDRLRFGLRLALTPNVGEWKSVNIPDRLFPLYRGIRMIRLLRRLRAA